MAGSCLPTPPIQTGQSPTPYAAPASVRHPGHTPQTAAGRANIHARRPGGPSLSRQNTPKRCGQQQAQEQWHAPRVAAERLLCAVAVARWLGVAVEPLGDLGDRLGGRSSTATGLGDVAEDAIEVRGTQLSGRCRPARLPPFGALETRGPRSPSA